MMSRIAGDKLLVRHTMQFNPWDTSIEPDPAQRFNHFGDGLLAQSKSPSVETADTRFLTGRKSDCNVLKSWRPHLIRVHTTTIFERILPNAIRSASRQNGLSPK